MPISSFIKNVRSLWSGTYQTYDNQVIPNIISGTNSTFNIANADKVAAVYTSIKVLSDAVARMPLNIYSDENGGKTVNKNDYRYSILHYNPNAWTSQQTFFGALEYWRNLKGNAFAKIHRDDFGRVVSLTLIKPSFVKGYGISNDQLYYFIENENKETETVNASEILHFRTITRDGIWGINPIETLRLNISMSSKGLEMMDSFYGNHAMAPKALKPTVGGANSKALLDGLKEFKEKYTGPANAGNLPILPPNTDLVDMSMNIADAQFIETLKFNAQQIAALYGVPAWMVGILEQTKFASVETTQRDFMASTLGAILRAYRQELESKLLTTEERLNGVSIEFNTEAFYELDTKSRIENLKNLASIGVIDINTIAKIEGYPQYPEGNVHLVPGNYLPVEQIVKKSIPLEK